MSGALMNKVWDLFGMDSAEPEEYEDENVYDYTDEDEVEDRKFFGKKNNNNKVVSMPQTQIQSQAIKMVISQPTTFEQSDEICSFLKEKKSVIVNLEYVNKDVARRIVDFISGGVYALDGYIQKVSNSIFLVAPSNYEITNDMGREEMRNKLSVSWLKNNNLNYVLCIVIRYFGGIKLGASGLIRAYSRSAKEALEKTSIINLTKGKNITIEFNYENIKQNDR